MKVDEFVDLLLQKGNYTRIVNALRFFSEKNIEDISYLDLRKVKGVGRNTVMVFADEVIKLNQNLLHPTFSDPLNRYAHVYHTPEATSVEVVRLKSKTITIAKCVICKKTISATGWRSTVQLGNQRS